MNVGLLHDLLEAHADILTIALPHRASYCTTRRVLFL